MSSAAGRAAGLATQRGPSSVRNVDAAYETGLGQMLKKRYGNKTGDEYLEWLRSRRGVAQEESNVTTNHEVGYVWSSAGEWPW